MFFLPLIGWQRQHTPLSRDAARRFERAMREAGLTRKEAAGHLEVSEQQLSRIIAGVEGLNDWKAAQLPQEFHIALWKLSLEEAGWDCLPPGALQAIVRGLDRFLGFLGLIDRKALRVPINTEGRGAA